MMNYLWLPFILMCSLALGQNLVPNESFESSTSCPTFASQLDLAAPWYNPTPGTPEYYNACATSASYASVPNNLIGGFQPARTGQGYTGIYVYRTDIPQMREYMEIPLSAPLEAGQCYHFEMYVNLHNSFQLAVDGVGAYFSVGPVGSTSISVLPYTPQVQNPAGNILSDTLNWTLVSGYFTAEGGEDHLTIGNFKTDAATNVQNFNPGAPYQNESYLLVEDVSLVATSNLELDLGADTTVCGGDPLVLDATQPDATYLWQDGTTTPTYTVWESGTYWVTAFMGTCSLSDTIEVEYYPTLESNLEDTTLCNGRTLTINLGQEGATYLWDNGSTDAIREIDLPGSYWVSMTNSCGTITDDFEVDYEICYCTAYVPNAFTPDHSGRNDVFAPVVDCTLLDTYSFQVYNRWGELIFESIEPGEAWDGKHQSMDCSPGIYTWHLLYTGSESGQEVHANQHGLVTLLR